MPRRPRSVRSGPVASVVVALLLGVSACSGSKDATAPESGSSSGAAPTSTAPTDVPTDEPVTTKATVGRIAGSMERSLRKKMRDRVAGTVDQWIDAAYGGTYPREDFDDAFAVFTEGAERRAKHDRDLMSNARLGADLSEVAFTQRRLRIDVLATQGKAVAVTARVALGMTLTGAATTRERVVGSLYLTYSTGGWHVFGYDIDRKEV